MDEISVTKWLYSWPNKYEQWNAFLGKRISWFALCPWCQRGRVIWYCCHQVQRGRLLALWCMCCTWWQTTHRRSTHLYISRWIYGRDIRWQFSVWQVQRGRLLALWDKCCPWWQITQMINYSAANLFDKL